MTKRILKLRIAFYAPVVIAAIRIILSLVIFISNPFGMSMRFFQLLPFGVIVVYLFTYLKMFSDDDPVVTLLLPSIFHFIAVYLFSKQLQVGPFIVPFVVDCLFLIVKGLKASLFPFKVEGDDNDKAAALLSELEETDEQL